MKFTEFNFSQELNDALDSMGFVDATPIQQEAIPLILGNHDLIACAQTGTGKTGAFLLPVLQKIWESDNRDSVNTLVIVPTRELAIQIDQQVEAMSYFLGISSIAVYGGGDKNDWDKQQKALSTGADIVIATPGRLIAHMQLGYVKMKNVQQLILDEADRMLDMGFLSDIMSIIKNISPKRQNLLFSATMPKNIRDLSSKILIEPKTISLSISKPAAGVLQGAYLINDIDKAKLIVELLKDKRDKYKSVIVFSSTKKNVSNIVGALKKARIDAAGISSDLDQKERERVLLSFRNRKTQIIVATDILSRGIDITDINLVINFDVPNDAEDYVHRIGRTARANTTGVALTLINKYDIKKFKDIEAMIEDTVQKIPLPEGYAEGPDYSRSYGKKPRGGGGKKFGGKRSSGSGKNRNYKGKGSNNKNYKKS